MTIAVTKLSSALGAEISGVNLNNLDTEGHSSIRDLLFEYGVICFRDQPLTHQSHAEFAAGFGALETHPIVLGMEQHPEIIKMHKPAGQSASFGVGWHTDNTFFKAPSLGSVLYAEIIPSSGGDTLFASQWCAFETLPGDLQRRLEGMRAVHCAREAYTSGTALEKYDGDSPIRYRRSAAMDEEVTHPVVIRHPATGRKALFVNPMFTMRFEGMTEAQSEPLLKELCAHAVQESLQCRLTWERHTVTMWDNRLVMHCALNDYPDEERLIYRITINGDELE